MRINKYYGQWKFWTEYCYAVRQPMSITSFILDNPIENIRWGICKWEKKYANE